MTLPKDNLYIYGWCIEYLKVTPVHVYKNRHIPKAEIQERVLKAAEILQITEYLDRKPKALSGGQCQRVALGRAIVRTPKLFLMDEPLSNLDAKLRVQMRSEIINLHNRLNATTIYVTHDQTEAMTMATRIVIMNKGVIQQIGTPREIYNNPANVFVATFIGSPSMNLYDVQFKDDKVIFEGEIEIEQKSYHIKVNYKTNDVFINGEIHSPIYFVHFINGSNCDHFSIIKEVTGINHTNYYYELNILMSEKNPND